MTSYTFFDLFQLTMLVLFLVTFFGRTLYMRLARHINPISLGGKKKAIGQIIELAFPIWLILWIVEVLRTALHLEFRILPTFLETRLFNGVAVQIAGALLIVFGYSLFVGALLSFGESWRVGIDDKHPGVLVTSGVFALSRNPIFLFLNLYSLGSFLVNGTITFLLFAVLLGAALHYQILQEEKFLLNTYGDAYRTYLEHTARYLSLRPHA